MRKFSLLFIAVSCLLIVNAQLVRAQTDPKILWFVAQHRIYEDGRDITKVIMQLEDLTLDHIVAVRFYEPGSTDPSDLVTLDNALESSDCTIFSNYFFNTGWGTVDHYWDWSPVISDIESDNWGDEYYVSWELYEHTLTPGGTYRIEVDYDSTTLSKEYVFSDYYPLPIVSLVADQPIPPGGIINIEPGSYSAALSREYVFSDYYPSPSLPLVADKERNKKDTSTSDSDRLNIQVLPDGSLCLKWTAPAVSHEDTSARVFIYLETSPGPGECYRYITFKAPTHLGMLIMPPEAVEAIKNSTHFNGYFGFGLQIRVNDNSERSYSKTIKYYPL